MVDVRKELCKDYYENNQNRISNDEDRRNEDSKTVTILTPSYNRAHTLTKLYESLCKQTSNDFVWMVVDDGSSDDTEKLINSFIQDDKIAIEYYRKENAGKHTALNFGIEKIHTPLTFIVDSDDSLTESAVSTIKEYDDRFKDNKDICGFSFLRVDSKGVVNTGKYKEDDAIDTFVNKRINDNLLGDKAEVYYTDILRKYPFEVFEGEKFMPEDSVWVAMSGPYKMVHANREIYICDYLEGGLTKSGKSMKICSPYGMMYRSSVYLNSDVVCKKAKLKMLVLYIIYEHFANLFDKEKNISQNEIKLKKQKCQVKGKLWYSIMWLPSSLIFLLWKVKYLK